MSNSSERGTTDGKRSNQRIWRYRIHVISASSPDKAQLDQLGEAGWELVSAVGVGELGATDEIWLFFKKEASR